MKRTYEHPAMDVELLNADIICASGDVTTVQSDNPDEADNSEINYSNFDSLDFTF